MTCPNRDGKIGTKGCIFCGEQGSGDFTANKNLSITKQIEETGMQIEKNIDNNYEIIIQKEEQAHQLMNKLVEQGILINKFELKKPSLNDIFIEKVGE